MKVGDSDFTPQMLRAKNAGADTILSYSNAVEMANALKAGNKIGYKPKVLSAWGLANPTFPSLAGPLSDGVMVMQTFTFVRTPSPRPWRSSSASPTSTRTSRTPTRCLSRAIPATPTTPRT